ncbi:hypothetical protein [Neolewinella persica]|uniref:hypothetical protein n=1 Tax=Neolewinella persica TaxID=70998 RepID=UPI0003A6D158|nr:hypothetical protein [Neolewinella persica]
MSHSSSRFLALVGMLVMLVLYVLNASGNLGPNPIGTTSTATNPLIVPAPYAFAIWAPIYTGLIIFPIFQLFKKRENHPAWIPLRQWFAANVVANGVWLAFASYDWQWLTVAVIVFMLISLFEINRLLRTIEAAKADRSYWLERLVFSLYFAWVTLATVLNVSSALHFYGWDGFGVSEVTWTIIMIVVAALIAGYTSLRYRDPAFAGVVVWAFIALTIKHWAGTPVLGMVAGAVAVVFAGIMVWNAQRRVVAG